MKRCVRCVILMDQWWGAGGEKTQEWRQSGRSPGKVVFALT